MERKKRGYENIMILISIIIFLFFLCFFWDFYYGVNDDIATRNVFSGGYTGVPRPQRTSCVVTLYPIAFCISGLYGLVSGIDFWGIFLAASHPICFWLIAKTVLGAVKDKGNKIGVFIVTFLVFWTVDLVNLMFFQFTTVAAIYAATGIFLLFMESRSGISYIPSICMLIMSYGIRKKITMMAFPFIGLIWIYKAYKGRHDIKRVVKQGICYFVITGLLCGSMWVMDFCANKESYYNKYYQDYEALRVKAWDYHEIPDYDTNAVFYQSLGDGFSREEYGLVSQGNMAMDFSMDVKEALSYMVKYSETNKRYLGLKYKIQVAMNLFITVFNRILIKPLVTIVGIMLILVLVYLKYARRISKLIFLLMGELGAVAEAGILLYTGRMPERIWQSLLLFAVAWMFGILIAGEHESLEEYSVSYLRIRRTIFLVAMFCLLVFCFWLIPSINKTQARYEKTYHKSKVINEYCMGHSENIYCCPYSFFNGDVDKLGSGSWYSDQFKNYIRIGWGAFNPAYYAMLERAGITGTVEEAIMTQDNVLMMGTYDQNSLPLFDSYFTWKYGDDYSYKVVDVIEEYIYVWEVHLQEE